MSTSSYFTDTLTFMSFPYWDMGRRAKEVSREQNSTHEKKANFYEQMQTSQMQQNPKY